jgi:InsA C-terminal domain
MPHAGATGRALPCQGSAGGGTGFRRCQSRSSCRSVGPGPHRRPHQRTRHWCSGRRPPGSRRGSCPGGRVVDGEFYRHVCHALALLRRELLWYALPSAVSTVRAIRSPNAARPPPANNAIAATIQTGHLSRGSSIPAYKGRFPAIQQQVLEMRLNASGVWDTAGVLQISTRTVLNELRKKGLCSQP